MATKHEPPESGIRDQRRQPGWQDEPANPPRNQRKDEKDPSPTELRKAEGEERRELLEEKPYDFIERTKPEDKLDERGGQQTRDNVNPHIPSVPREAIGPAHARISNPGGIVDPNTLGMDQSQQGVAPPPAQPEQRQLPEGATALDLENHLPSINEPPGSDIYAGVAGEVNLPPLDLAGVNPDSVVISSAPDVTIAVHGTGFTPNSVVVVDDEEVPTTFVNIGKLTAQVPMATEPGEVDVEVSRGEEELSEVLTFEFLAAEGGARSRAASERKPKKAEPASKRTKKSKK